MKKIFYSILAAAAVLTGCNREIIESEGQGSLALDLNCKTDYTEVTTKALQTEEEIKNNLAIDIVRSDGFTLSFDHFSEIKGQVIELGSGSYTLKAYSPVQAPAAFDQPIFEGEKDFVIRTGEVTTVDLTCTISNLMVTVQLTENFVKELSDYEVLVSNGDGLLKWTATPDASDFEPAEAEDKDGKPITVYQGKKAGYFAVSPLTITVKGHRGIDGTTASTEYHIDAVRAADHHIVLIDANVIGSLGGVNITVSDAVNRIPQDVVVPGFTETPVPEGKPDTGGDGDTGDTGNGDGGNSGTEPDQPVTPANGPKLVWEANPEFMDLELPLVQGANPKLNGQEVSVDLIIKAEEGIEECTIEVDSKLCGALFYTFGVGTSAEGPIFLDLINDPKVVGSLGDIFPVGDKVKGQTEVLLSMSELVPLINSVAGAFNIVAGDTHKFTISVVDAKGLDFEQVIYIKSVAA